MFICDFCGKGAPAGARCTLIAVQKKEIQHPYRGFAHKRKREDGKVEFQPDEGGRGIQVAKEKKACPTCAEQHRERQRAEAIAQQAQAEAALAARQAAAKEKAVADTVSHM